MKPTTITRSLLILALLSLASPSLHAAKTISGLSSGLSSALKKNKVSTDGPAIAVEHDWYLGLSASYVKTNNALLDKFKGAGLIFGYRISPDDRLQLEIGCNTGSYDGLYHWTMPMRLRGGSTTTINGTPTDGVLNKAVPMTGAVSAKSTMMPVLLTYSYCIHPFSSPKLADSRFFSWLSTDRFEARLTPIIGMFAMKGTWTTRGVPYKTNVFIIPKGTTTVQYSVTYPGYSGGNAVNLWPMDPASGSDSVKLAATVGIGAGLSYSIASRLQLDLDYRYFWVAKTVNSNPTPEWDGLNAENGGAPYSGQPWNSASSWNGMNVTQITASLSWKF